jgi:hypothetical protein
MMSKSVLLELLPVVGVCRRAEIRESRTERSSGLQSHVQLP